MRWVDGLVLVWFGGLSLVAFLMFGWDKWRASRSGRRVSERTLILLGALGGWPGGFLGARLFRHKTIKRSFRIKYAMAFIPFGAAIASWWYCR